MLIQKSILNLHTEWESHGDRVNVEHRVGCCYSDNFKHFFGKQNYKIWIYKDLMGYTELNHRNNTFLSLGGLIEHIQFIKDYLPENVLTRFSIEESTVNSSNDEKFVPIPIFVVNLEINGENIYHKFILTWIRYAYELPYSLILLDAIRLGELDEFKHLNLLNRFLLCSSGWSEDAGYYWRSDMSMGHYTLIHSNDYIRDRLVIEAETHPELGFLCDVFGEQFFNDYDERGTKRIPNEYLLETDNWVNGDLFEMRLEIYKNNYKICYKNESTTT